MNEQYLLSKTTVSLIKKHHAKKILTSIVDYNAKLGFDDAMNLVEYENSITTIIFPAIVQGDDNMFSFPNKEEKEALMNDIILELDTLEQIKKHLHGEKYENSNSNIAETRNGGNI